MEELDDSINVPREKVWAQTMLFACDVTNRFVTTSTEEGMSLCKLWFGTVPIPDHSRLFEVVGYVQRSVHENKMTPRGKNCVFIQIPRNVSSSTICMLLVKTRKIVGRQAVQWVDGPDKTGSDGVGDETSA